MMDTTTENTTTVTPKMSNFKYLAKMLPSFTMIAVICLGGFLKSTIREERLRKEERSLLQQKIQHEAEMNQRELFLTRHRDFVETFLEFDGQCNKIHALVHRPRYNSPEVKLQSYSNSASSSMNAPHNRIGDSNRKVLNNTVIYFFFALMAYLLVRAIIDVYQELTTPRKIRSHFSLKDYATSSRTYLIWPWQKKKLATKSESQEPLISDQVSEDDLSSSTSVSPAPHSPLSHTTSAPKSIPSTSRGSDDNSSGSVLRHRGSISVSTARRQSSFSITQHAIEGNGSS